MFYRTLRLWAYSGECLKEMHGHSSFVFSVATVPGGLFASGGEDRGLKIWKGIKRCIYLY